MNRILLTGLVLVLVLVCGVGCGASTLIGKTDGGGCGVTYPESGFYGPNILYPGLTSLTSQPSLSTIAPPNYELVASHPLGATVKLNMTLLSGSVWYIGGAANDWRATLYDSTTGEQTFQTPDVAAVSESSIFFVQSGEARLDVFECGSATPTSRTISWSVGDAGLGDGSVGDDAARDAGGLGFPPPIGIPGLDAGTGNGQD
jgi:hypothetical protein